MSNNLLFSNRNHNLFKLEISNISLETNFLGLLYFLVTLVALRVTMSASKASTVPAWNKYCFNHPLLAKLTFE